MCSKQMFIVEIQRHVGDVCSVCKDMEGGKAGKRRLGTNPEVP